MPRTLEKYWFNRTKRYQKYYLRRRNGMLFQPLGAELKYSRQDTNHEIRWRLEFINFPDRTEKDTYGRHALLDTSKVEALEMACEIYGYSRDSYYRWKKIEREYAGGLTGYLGQCRRGKPNLKNRISHEIEHELICLTLEKPSLGQFPISELMKKAGFEISPSGVRSVWRRNNLETKEKRFAKLNAQ